MTPVCDVVAIDYEGFAPVLCLKYSDGRWDMIEVDLKHENDLGELIGLTPYEVNKLIQLIQEYRNGTANQESDKAAD